MTNTQHYIMQFNYHLHVGYHLRSMNYFLRLVNGVLS